MTIFSCNNLSKKFDDKFLFENISFGMEEGEKLCIIGQNGIGKTTLLRIIAQVEDSDTGNVIFNNKVTFEYLPQIPDFAKNEIILDYVMSSKAELFNLFNEYKFLTSKLSNSYNEELSKKLEKIIHNIDISDGWNIENEAKRILSVLGIDDVYKDTTKLSGGQRKRVALARALLSNPSLLILDEPTNHLDADSVQWLQDRLISNSVSLLFISHDRYFLDSVSTRIVEIYEHKIFSYPGSYEKYLELKDNFLAIQDSSNEHLRNRLHKELDWLAHGARARRTKQKSRIDWIEKMQVDERTTKEKKIKIEFGANHLGGRILDATSICKSLGGKSLFTDFTYLAAPKDRIGIIGPNGSGKTTFLKVLANDISPDFGKVKLGLNTNIGFFKQELNDFKPMDTVIGALKEVAEYIDVGVGRDRYLTTKDLLNKFLFPPQQHTSLVSSLSGGERRRLELLRVLMANPNVLFLDEPTNDLDINTLMALEDFLEDFVGVLLIVSHDRAFLDKIVDFIWAFDNHGHIKEYPGNYSSYLEKKEQEQKFLNVIKKEKQEKNNYQSNNSLKKKLSYKEQREFDTLESEISDLEAKKVQIESLLNSGNNIDYKELEKLSHDLVETTDLLDDKMIKWLELSESFE